MDKEEAPRARDEFRSEYRRQRAGAHRKWNEGGCYGTNKDGCYDTCEFSTYCAEWRHLPLLIF